MKVTAEFDKDDIKKLGKDLDDLFLGIAKELNSVKGMKPIVQKIQQGMAENEMGFSNSEIWHKNKHSAALYGIVDFDSPLMMTGQLFKDFKFESVKTGSRALKDSDGYIIGGLTWEDKERKRPTYKHIMNQLAIKSGGTSIYEDAEKFSYLKSSELVKIIMKSPRYPIMDSIMNLYEVDVQLHMEKIINEAFKKIK